ncbi:hypothetical protein [Ruegeria sp. MALMAid1280]|uniref:hypothetical protein n=1 Tax=Ruegeria sp. MALMAid1280 TaxID=3411634 RepID=UPI003BA0D433
MQSARQLVSDYRQTWESVIRGDAPLKELDRFFNVPCFMVSLDGQMTLYVSQTEITDFNQTRLDAFRAGGVHNASLRAVDLFSQGPHLSLAVVNWELTREDGSLERAWRHYYTILDNENGVAPTIVISAFQTGS